MEDEVYIQDFDEVEDAYRCGHISFDAYMTYRQKLYEEYKGLSEEEWI